MIYYLKILFLLLTQTQNWPTVLFTKKVILKNGLSFNIRNFMDWYVIIETVILNCYHFKTQPVVIDIGAAIGDFSIFSSLKSKHVYAIEPEPSSYQLLLQNIKINKITNISSFPLALYSNAKTINLSINNSNHHHTNNYSPTNIITVPCISLTKFIEKIDQTDLYIKCDCEGGEYDIFNTLPASTFSKINQVDMEFHLFTPTHYSQFEILKKTFSKNNFKLNIISNPIHREIGFLFASRIH